MKYEKLKESLCRELDEIERKDEISAGDLEAAYKLTDTIKNILKIDMLKEASDGYSGHYPYSYDDDASYRGRDSRGRYSRDYSRDGRGGYSRAAESDIMEMMRNASGSDREALQRALDVIRRG